MCPGLEAAGRAGPTISVSHRLPRELSIVDGADYSFQVLKKSGKIRAARAGPNGRKLGQPVAPAGKIIVVTIVVLTYLIV